MNDDELPQWMYASACTYSFEIKTPEETEIRTIPIEVSPCSGSTVLFQYKETEPEMLIEFDYDRYGNNIKPKPKNVFFEIVERPGRALVNRYILGVDPVELEED